MLEALGGGLGGEGEDRGTPRASRRFGIAREEGGNDGNGRKKDQKK